MKPELISPAGNWISLKAAIQAGADAVYFGVKEFNQRINAENFGINEIKEVAQECHKNNLKAYLTLNSIIYDEEIKKIRKILAAAKKAEIDVVIAWDFSVIKLCDELEIPVHLSTQASISNYEAIKFFKSKIKSLKCVVLARELSLNQIQFILNKIKEDNLQLEVETFVHGAMCVSVSGRCFMSHHLFGRSANRGDCLQPCRRRYILNEAEDKYHLELGEDYILSPKDLCTLPFIDKLVKSGISKFKIEGRNRSPEYVKVVTECYRKAIDAVAENKFSVELSVELMKRLRTVYNRGFSSGFYLGMPTTEDFTEHPDSQATARKIYAGYVTNFFKKKRVAQIKIEAGKISLGDRIMFQGSTTGVVEQEIASIFSGTDEIITHAEKGQVITLKADNLVRKNDKVYITGNFNKL